MHVVWPTHYNYIYLIGADYLCWEKLHHSSCTIPIGCQQHTSSFTYNCIIVVGSFPVRSSNCLWVQRSVTQIILMHGRNSCYIPFGRSMSKLKFQLQLQYQHIVPCRPAHIVFQCCTRPKSKYESEMVWVYHMKLVMGIAIKTCACVCMHVLLYNDDA